MFILRMIGNHSVFIYLVSFFKTRFSYRTLFRLPRKLIISAVSQTDNFWWLFIYIASKVNLMLPRQYYVNHVRKLYAQISLFIPSDHTRHHHFTTLHNAVNSSFGSPIPKRHSWTFMDRHCWLSYAPSQDYVLSFNLDKMSTQCCEK